MKAPLGHIGLVTSTPVHLAYRSNLSTCRPDSPALASILAGSVLLDNKGSILSCTDAVAHLCGIAAEELADRPIKSLVPGVPLDPGTEGYNVAFVSFSSSTGRVGSWNLFTASGDVVPVEGTFTLLRVETRFLFRLELRWADVVSADTDRRKFPLRRARIAATSSIPAGRRRKKKYGPLELVRPGELTVAEPAPSLSE